MFDVVEQIEYAWQSSSTLRTGLYQLARYHRLIGERGATEIEESPQGIKVRFLAKRMHTSRAALNRLLDDADPSLTLTTLASAAAALGRKVNIQFAAV